MMPTESPSLGPTERAYLTVLSEARQLGFTMTRTKVAKLLYLADLELTRERGHQATEARWKWLHFGPYDRTLMTVEEDLQQRHFVTVTETSTYYGNPEMRVELVQVEETDLLQGSASRVIADVVRQFGNLAATSLGNLTYRTEPMLKAQEEGKREVDLDMDIVQSPPSHAAQVALMRLREAASSLPVEESDPDAMRDLEEDIEAFDAFRARANRELLG